MWGGVGREACWEGEPGGRTGFGDVGIGTGQGLKSEGSIRTKIGTGLSGGSGLCLGGWQCQAGPEGVLPASTPPPGSECGRTLPLQLSLGPRHACLGACGWGLVDRG